jgi:hypothetical protein
MDMNTLLESLYENNTPAGQEKTAEAAMFAQLSDTPQQDNPLMDLSMEDLVKLAQELDIEDAGPTIGEGNEDLEKTAFDMLGGQVMAHAMVHEFGLMKQAMVEGLCRVCKTNSMDIQGSSICNECLAE